MSIDVPHRHVETVLREMTVDAPASGTTNGSAAPAPASPPAAPPATWQPVVGELFSMAHAWHRERVETERWSTLAASLLVGITLVGATLLAWHGVLDGQAIAALFGGAAGFILAKMGTSARLF